MGALEMGNTVQVVSLDLNSNILVRVIESLGCLLNLENCELWRLKTFVKSSSETSVCVFVLGVPDNLKGKTMNENKSAGGCSVSKVVVETFWDWSTVNKLCSFCKHVCLELCNEPVQGTDLKKEKNDLTNFARCAVVCLCKHGQGEGQGMCTYF